MSRCRGPECDRQREQWQCTEHRVPRPHPSSWSPQLRVRHRFIAGSRVFCMPRACFKPLIFERCTSLAVRLRICEIIPSRQAPCPHRASLLSVYSASRPRSWPARPAHVTASRNLQPVDVVDRRVWFEAADEGNAGLMGLMLEQGIDPDVRKGSLTAPPHSRKLRIRRRGRPARRARCRCQYRPG